MRLPSRDYRPPKEVDERIHKIPRRKKPRKKLATSTNGSRSERFTSSSGYKQAGKVEEEKTEARVMPAVIDVTVDFDF